MKKFLLSMLFMLTALCMNAQVNVVEKYDSQKFFDNTYVTVNGGVATKTTEYPFWKDMNANAGIRLGKDINPVFGVAIGSNAYFSEFAKQSNESSKTVKYLNTTVLAKVNVINCFNYNPNRKFNLSVLVGPGWGHSFVNDRNDVTANFSLNASYDITNRWCVYIEPSLMYGLQRPSDGKLEFNINRSVVQLNGGISYRFGKTKFTKTKYVAYTDYKDLNNTVNELREELAKKPKTVEVIKTVTNDVVKYIYIAPGVSFDKGSANLDYKSAVTIDAIAKLNKNVVVTGYASKDNYKKNTELSQNRAEVVADALTNAGLSRDKITVKYLGDSEQPFTPTESNRVATITIVD